jgi:hypothetical protein
VGGMVGTKKFVESDVRSESTIFLLSLLTQQSPTDTPIMNRRRYRNSECGNDLYVKK